jgi:hypothetical protein
VAEARQFPDSFVAFLSDSRSFPSDSVVLAQALSNAAEPHLAVPQTPLRQAKPEEMTALPVLRLTFAAF